VEERESAVNSQTGNGEGGTLLPPLVPPSDLYYVTCYHLGGILRKQ